ncbi:MAG: patatin [Rhodocyclales bacterium RIFCSPLOWO2_02_FULL_63_24]|nr:MAG: patatin [Rhodocyclales bacterium RIFCSPLOWO2_02_FULL_63_24]
MCPASRPPQMAVALAGGGPLGAIYEIGALMALAEALDGFDFNDLDAYVGVSAGGFIAAGLANGLSPAYMYRMFIDSDSAEIPFDPEMLLKPAFGEYARRAGTVPALLWASLGEYLRDPLRRDLVASFARLSRAIPTGIFNNAGVGEFLRRLFALPGLTNDFRQLKRRLFLIATDLDSGAAVAFGSKGHDHVPIATAIQASSALPGLFPPVEIDGRWFVDGALKKTLHASVALKAGARLVLCINPLVPFDAKLASHEKHLKRRQLVDGGLPVVLAQTFRSIIHSRMETGLAKYDIEYTDADVILFEPHRDDADMFFTNMFSYGDRKRLSEQAYRKTREELLRRYDELAPKLARHGVAINRAVLVEPHRSLARRMAQLKRRRVGALGRTALVLSDTLDDLGRVLKRLQHRQRLAA